MLLLLAELLVLLAQLRGLGLRRPAMIDLIAGQVHIIFDNIPGALAQYRPGKVRGFAVTSAQRSQVVPDIPALNEFLPGFDIKSWTALVGPAKLPPPVVDRPYDLEYGTGILEMQRGHGRLLLVDDVLATGGTAEATADLIRRLNAEVVGVAVLIELLGLGGRERLARLPVTSLLKY